MGTRDPRVDAYIAKSEPFAQPILTHIRRVVHAACPDVEEGMKWSVPHFMHKGILCGMASFKQHCAFSFWKASLLEGVGGKKKDAMGQFGRITAIEDLPAERTLRRLVKDAARLNEQGVKAPRRVSKKARPDTAPPADLAAGLKKNRKAAAAFQGLSPSHRREYIEWITEAKGEATRARRLATTLQWLAEGKRRNWQYERKG
jgi:uncharacterized protein YdeI (YjbR/CyaY-like superfamily)